MRILSIKIKLLLNIKRNHFLLRLLSLLENYILKKMSVDVVSLTNIFKLLLKQFVQLKCFCNQIYIIYNELNLNWLSSWISISIFQSDSTFGSLFLNLTRNSTEVELLKDWNPIRVELNRITRLDLSRI